MVPGVVVQMRIQPLPWGRLGRPKAAASLSGSISYWQEDLIPIAPLSVAIPMHLIGIWLGVKLVHAVDQRLATQAVAVLGMATGIGILTLAVVR